MRRRTTDPLVYLSVHSRVTTRKTPFSLTYGFEVVVLTALELPTYRVTNYNNQENGEALRRGLDMVEEKRDHAYIRMATYKQRVSQYFNNKVKSRSF